jgi:hypothetical protein
MVSGGETSRGTIGGNWGVGIAFGTRVFKLGEREGKKRRECGGFFG